jgi:hypothetical protein
MENKTTFNMKHLTHLEAFKLLDALKDNQSMAETMLIIGKVSPTNPSWPAIDWSDRYGWTALTVMQVLHLKNDFVQALDQHMKSTGDHDG